MDTYASLSNTLFLIIGSVLFFALAVMYARNIFKKKLKNRWFIAPIYTLVVMALALITHVAWVFALGFPIYFVDSKLRSMDKADETAEKRKIREERYGDSAAPSNKL